MSDDAPELKLKEDAPIHGVWFWKLAIFEGFTSTFIAMAGAITAAGATWDSSTVQSMEWWQWSLFSLGVITAGLKTLQAFTGPTRCETAVVPSSRIRFELGFVFSESGAVTLAVLGINQTVTVLLTAFKSAPSYMCAWVHPRSQRTKNPLGKDIAGWD